MHKKKSPAPEEAGLTNFVCVDKQPVIDILQEFKGGVKARGGGIIYFHRDGKPGCRFSLDPEKRKRLNRKLRDENITIVELRGRPDLIANFKEAIDLHCTPLQIRRKLRGGKRGKQED